MWLLIRNFAFLLLCLSAAALADLNEKNKVQYPNLARAVAYCLDTNDPSINGINWSEVNDVLEQPYSLNPALWLETHSWWSLNPQSFSSTAVWLLPDAAAWGEIDIFHNEVFMHILQFYHAEFFERINASELLKRLKANKHFDYLLSYLLKKGEYAYLIRFILRHLQQLSNLESFSQTNFHSILNATNTLDWLIRYQQELKLSDQFITGALNWAFACSYSGVVNLVMDFLKSAIVNLPHIISMLNELSPSQFQKFLDILAANHSSLTSPLTHDAIGIQQQTTAIEAFIEQAQSLNSAQIDMIDAAIHDIPSEAPSQQTQPSDIMQSFILIHPNDNSGQATAVEFTAGECSDGEWQVIQ